MILSDDQIHEMDQRIIQGNLESLDCHEFWSLFGIDGGYLFTPANSP